MRTLFLSILAVILLGFIVWLMFYLRRGTNPRREIIKARGRRAFDRAARLERPGGPETIDFRTRMWGHNVEAEFDSDLVAHGFFWAQQKVYAGDYMTFFDRDHQLQKYRFTFVQHTGNVDDMYRFEAVPTGATVG